MIMGYDVVLVDNYEGMRYKSPETILIPNIPNG